VGGTAIGQRSDGGLVSKKNKKREREAHSLEREGEGVDARSNGYQDGALKIICVRCETTGKRMVKAFHRRVVWPQEKSE